MDQDKTTKDKGGLLDIVCDLNQEFVMSSTIKQKKKKLEAELVN